MRADSRAKMKKPPFLVAVCIAAALLIAAMPAYAWNNRCKFQAKGLSMSFGALDPSSGSNVTVPVSAATLNANNMGSCRSGNQMAISGDNGLNFSGSRRLKRIGSADYIPYTLSSFPTGVPGPGNGVYTSFTFNGTILGTAYANAPAGTYTDTVIISVTP